MTYLNHAFFLDTVELRLLPEGEPIRQQAKKILDNSVTFQETVSSVGNKWQGLGPVYEAPEQDLVLQAMDEPILQAAEHVDGVRDFHAGLDAFAFELDEVRRAVSELNRDADAASLAWFDTLDELNANDASSHEMESARADAIAPLEARLKDIYARYERARADCERSLASITRSSPDVISSYPSLVMDLASGAREDTLAAFDKATAPGASQEDIAAFYNLLLLAGPELLKEIGRRPGAAHFVDGLGAHEEVAFWNTLNYVQQEALLLALPGLVGNLEGAPYATRDKANRKLLGIVQEEYKKEEASGNPYPERREGLSQLLNVLGDSAVVSGNYLVSLNPRISPPLAQVGVGDLDTAQNVTYLIPGMNSSTANAASLVDQAKILLGEQASGPYGASTAAVAYMNYRSPDWITVAGEESAENGAPAFADALDGLYLTRSHAGSIPEVNLVAHSYGTTMASIALGQTHYSVTSTVFLASAGLLDGTKVTDLNVDSAGDGQANVYVTLADADRWAGVGWTVGFRTNPANEDDPWGGQLFSSNEVVVDSVPYDAVGSHDLSEYLDKRTFSLKITALVTGGRIQEALELVEKSQK